MEAFVYSWSDHKTAKIYVGVHKGNVEDGYVCSSKSMMVEHNKRPEDFTRQIIAKGTLNDCATLEVAIIKQLLKDKNTCYNRAAGKMIINDVPPRLGVPHSEEARKKISQANVNRKVSEKTKQLMSMRHSGNKYALGSIRSEEHKLAISIANKNKIISLETRKKIGENTSKKLTGKKLTAEHIEKMKKAVTGKPKSKEHVEKVRRALIEYWSKKKKEAENA